MPEHIALRLAADVATAQVTIDPTATPPVSPETLTVLERTLISFRIAAGVRSRYIFATQPAPIIVANGSGAFEAPVRRSDSLVTLLDLATVKGDFEYSINLVDTRNGQLVTIDPVIRNEG